MASEGTLDKRKWSSQSQTLTLDCGLVILDGALIIPFLGEDECQAGASESVVCSWAACAPASTGGTSTHSEQLPGLAQPVGVALWYTLEGTRVLADESTQWGPLGQVRGTRWSVCDTLQNWSPP